MHERKVLVLVDSCTVSLENKHNRLRDYEGLSRTGMNKQGRYFGLKLHPAIVYDMETNMMLGISSAQFVHIDSSTREEKGDKWSGKKQCIEEKESYKWIEACNQSKDVLSDATHITYVMDREADIIELLDRIPDQRTTLVVRVRSNRYVIDEQGKRILLNDLFARSTNIGNAKLKINSKKRKQGAVEFELRYERIKIPWRQTSRIKQKKNPDGVPMTVVEIKEVSRQDNEEPIVWRLYTSSEISNHSQVLELVDIYKRRWLIEEFFKLLKTDGYDIEGTEFSTGKIIRKLILLVMKASIKVLQLKAARDGSSSEKIDFLFNENEIRCLKSLNKKLAGGTVKQQNPHDAGSLAYASWIIARLGGWKEFYQPSRPPGTKTFVWGLEKFESIMIGYNILN